MRTTQKSKRVAYATRARTSSSTSPGSEPISLPIALPRCRETCTNSQTAALESLFLQTKGYPTTAQKDDIALRINKSPRSVSVWFNNRRHPRKSKTPPQVAQPKSIKGTIFALNAGYYSYHEVNAAEACLMLSGKPYTRITL